jgi:sugar lactone lactonase YvrE
MKVYRELKVLALLAAFLANAAWIRAADLFVISEGAGVIGSVLKVTPAGTVSTFVDNLQFPRGIATDSLGDIFVGLDFDILTIAPNGTRTTVSGLDAYFNLEVDRNDTLYATSSTHIDRLPPSGSFSTWVTGLRNSGGMAFDASGNLYMTDNLSLIYKFAPDGTRTTFATGLASPIDIVIDSHGDLFVSILSDGAIYKFTPSGTRSTFATGLTNPWGLARDADDNIYAAELTAGRITKVSPAGVKSTFASGLIRPQSMVFSPQPPVVPEPSTLRYLCTVLASLFARRGRAAPAVAPRDF